MIDSTTIRQAIAERKRLDSIISGEEFAKTLAEKNRNGMSWRDLEKEYGLSRETLRILKQKYDV